MNGARSGIRGADLPRDLFVQRHPWTKLAPARVEEWGGACPALDGM